MILAYISGPYRGKNANEVYENIQRARECSVFAWKRGYAVICPHMNTAFLDGIVPDEVFLKADLDIILRCDMMVMLHNWEASSGATTEHKLAKEIGLKIYYADRDGNF